MCITQKKKKPLLNFHFALAAFWLVGLAGRQMAPRVVATICNGILDCHPSLGASYHGRRTRTSRPPPVSQGHCGCFEIQSGPVPVGRMKRERTSLELVFWTIGSPFCAYFLRGEKRYCYWMSAVEPEISSKFKSKVNRWKGFCNRIKDQTFTK